MKIDVRVDIKGVKASLGKLRDEVSDRATVRALNKVATTVRAEASKEIRAVYNIKAKVAKGEIAITKARKNYLVAFVTASGKRLPLIEFDARWNRKSPPPIGASVKVLTKGGRKAVRGAFIAKAKGGKLGVFRRTGAARKPIEYLLSVGVRQAFASKAVNAALIKIVRQRFPIVFEQEYRFAISKLGLSRR